LLKKADKAFAAEHLLEPKDTNALALYQQVLSADKDNAAAQAGIEKIHKSLLQQAGVALDRGDEKNRRALIAAIAELAHPGGDLAALQTREKTLLQVMPAVDPRCRAAETGSRDRAPARQCAGGLIATCSARSCEQAADEGLTQMRATDLDRALGADGAGRFCGADKDPRGRRDDPAGSHATSSIRHTRNRRHRRQRARNS